MSNAAVGNVYDQIIKEVVETSRVDFEESGIDDSILEELRAGWQRKLSQLKVAEFPWDPKPDAPLGAAAGSAAAAVPSGSGFAPQRTTPQEGGQPLPASSGSNGQQPGGMVKQEPGIKQEPGLQTSMMPPTYSDPRSVAAERASQALQKNYGQRATSSINAIQAGMSQNPPHPGAMQQQQQPPNGHPSAEQVYHQQLAQQHNPAQQQQQQGQYQPSMPQTDGADGFDAEGVLVQRDAEGNMVEMGRFEIDRMIHARILENAKSMEGGGFMVPLKEATKHTRPRKTRKAAGASGQVDGGDDDDDDDEKDEDAINSDLDDTDDDREDSEVDEEGLSHIMLCMYDKVQRVKNKWKCTLKDGVLTVNGKEYLFHKATGEYEW
ncbi:related to transcription factor TFIIA-L [Cephalotrichum gorgonifer]|uniref:Transcription initiation factor IIA large subunit n=1 Tax=Cephalotrichum gorgonifer TaxID=2041049 RepID=A0AAE8SV36_9PEZI|nr:related to transcription factor TFIIA-L [Cephalotrichum gorgonifer]